MRFSGLHRGMKTCLNENPYLTIERLIDQT
jgi:hypothetical protein